MISAVCEEILEILLVEDNRGDVILVQEALKEQAPRANLNVVDNGSKAVEYLQRQPPYGNAPKPNLVILDLNLPKKNGLEILKEMKANEELKSIPVAVFTTSRSHDDILNTYG